MISVVIPAYNRENTIRRAVKSVLDQTYSDLEVLVVDDGSTDGTAEVLKQISDSRFSYLKMDANRGACAARNMGVAVARGEWVAFQDSDDSWHADKLEKQMAAFQAHKADIVFCAMRLLRADGTDGPTVPLPSLPQGFYSYEGLLKESIASTQVIMGRRDCFLAEPFDENMPRMQDWDLILRLSQKYHVYYLNEVLADVYLQADSLTMRPEKGLLAYWRIYEKNRAAIEQSPGIKARHIALEGYLRLLNGENSASFYARNLSARYGLKTNIKFAAKMLLASVGLLRRFSPPPGGRG
jgi:glycosyltransferase involved in cell wall biosynthesis